MRMSDFCSRVLVAAGLIFVSVSVHATNGGAHRERYPLVDAKQKLVDNRGNGFENLYGTRNFRAVLNGVYYRGGANNAYHRTNKRNNQNPLPNDGLQNLCEEGFSTAIYLYSNNYSTAPKTVNCVMNDGTANRLEYKQVSVLSLNNAQIIDLMALILDHVRNPAKGPIYAHCWNGWHASGATAAYALRQFCGFNADQAVAYWNQNTDGHNGSSYEGVRRRVRNFVPSPALNLTADERAAICPNPSDLKF